MIHIKKLYLKKRIPEISQLNLHIREREIYVLLSSEDTAFNHLVNIFSGLEKKFKGNVEIDGQNILTCPNQCRNNLVYLSNSQLWPSDMRAGEMISFLKNHLQIAEDEYEELNIKLNLDTLDQQKIGDIEQKDWRKILFGFSQFKKSNNYIFRDFAKNMPLDFNLEYKKNLHHLKALGNSILYLSDDVFFAPEIGDRIGFMKKGKLLLELKASAMKKMSLQELYFQFLSEK
jgi:ABC-type Na+ transport system ATPase subunit NatA